jgi:hypothetical protein
MQKHMLKIIPESVSNGFFLNDFVDYWEHVEPLKKLLTASESKAAWIEIERLNIDPQKFVFNFWHALQDNETLEHFRQKAIEAEKIENDLRKTLQSFNESQYNHFLPEHKRAIAETLEQMHSKRLSYKANCVVERLRNDANITHFQRKLADFFEHQTKKPQYDLIALCAQIAFDDCQKTFDFKSVYECVNGDKKRTAHKLKPATMQ